MTKNPVQILVVDDEESIRKTSSRILQRHGYQVHTAGHGKEAVLILEQHPVNLIVSDLKMPQMDGAALLAWVRTHQPGLPVVIATAYGTVESAVSVLKSGASDYLLKPFDADELLFTVDRCLAERAMSKRVDELEELNRMKSEFVSNVSHELRTPLSAMGGALELLGHDLKGKLEGVQKQLFQVVLNDFERLSHVIRNVLDYSRLENGKFKMVPQKIQLQQLITRSLQELSPLVDSKTGLTIATEFPLEPLTVMVDREQIFQVFMNLLSNAIKFTPEHGRVTLRVEDEGDHALCCVRDTGIGIDAEHHKKIFERFYQVDGSPTRNFGGTGIGLAIVKAIVDGHGGKIWVESEKGQGSAFFFTLPKELPAVPGAAA